MGLFSFLYFDMYLSRLVQHQSSSMLEAPTYISTTTFQMHFNNQTPHPALTHSLASHCNQLNINTRISQSPRWSWESGQWNNKHSSGVQLRNGTKLNSERQKSFRRGILTSNHHLQRPSASKMWEILLSRSISLFDKVSCKVMAFFFSCSIFVKPFSKHI